MRRFSRAGLVLGGAGYVTVTAAPSGNADSPSKTTTPFCTRPGMTMRSLFAAWDLESSANPANAVAVLERPHHCAKTSFLHLSTSYCRRPPPTYRALSRFPGTRVLRSPAELQP